ncbi:hypothetical protein LOCC1_G008517, partial [Lachnellula occidentalis]
MKLSTNLAVALVTSSLCAASENLLPTRDAAVNCSIGLARWSGTTIWTLTVYNVPQALRQDNTVIATLKNQNMGLGDSITVSDGVAHPITITNVDNVAAFDYDTQDVRASMTDPETGRTKVKLGFEIKETETSWTTDDCGAGSVVYAAGIESWSCDFTCVAAGAK